MPIELAYVLAGSVCGILTGAVVVCLIILLTKIARKLKKTKKEVIQ